MALPTIQLYEAWGLGIILLYPSRVLYTNQVGGHNCLQLTAQGVYVPMFDEIKGLEQEKKLYKHFTGSKWVGGCGNGIDEETANFIDSILSESYYTKYLTVDRTKLDDCVEAWIHVNIDTDLMGLTSPAIRNFDSLEAILTWANSD